MTSRLFRPVCMNLNRYVLGNRRLFKFKNCQPEISASEAVQTLLCHGGCPKDSYADQILTYDRKVRCAKTVKEILLNQKYLSIKTEKVEAWAIMENGKEPISVEDYGHQHLIKLKEHSNEKNDYKIVIDFSKYSSDSNPAYIEAPDRDVQLHSDVERIEYTTMNDVEARAVFLNLDKSNQATFKINIGYDSTVKTVANEEFISRTPMKYPLGWNLDEFTEIKNHESAFSLALALVAFESNTKEVTPLGSENRVMSDVTIRVSAEKNVLIHTKVTLKMAARIFLHFSKFFDVPYEREKLDFVVLPDPQIDVLGYYGLIFLGEKDVMKAFKKQSYKFSPVKYSVASKMCHVISSQWIGHSTTMSTWNDSWLHVGLNKFLEKFCVNNLFPSWKLSTEQKIMNSFLDLLLTEERGDFNPIQPLSSDFIFHKDSANKETISKVHFTLRMLSFIMRLGEEYESKFQRSIKTYLEQFKFKNSDLHQVWEIFTSVANEEEQILPDGITVQQIMESWLSKKGHPLVIVSRPEPTKISVTQKPFDSTDIDKLEDDQTTCWILPLRYKIKNDAENFEELGVRDWLKCDGQPLEIEVKENDWILMNLNLHVPARVIYDFDNWNLIEELLTDKKQFSNIEFSARIHLISDVFALAGAEKITYELLFNIMKYLTHEKSYICWQLAYEEIMKVRSRWLGTKLFEPFQKFILSIVRPVFSKEFQSIEEFVKSNRRLDLFENIIVKTMCTFEDSNCQEFGEKVLDNWYTGIKDDVKDLIPHGLFESIYCLAVKNADAKKWEFLYEYQKSYPDDRILSALGCSSNTNLLRRFNVYGTLVTRGNIKPEFCFKVFNSLLRNQLGFPIIEEHLHLGMKNLSIHLLNQGRVITVEDILAKVYAATKTKDHLKRLEKAYSEVRPKMKDKAVLLEESKFKAEKNISWLQKYENSLLKNFENLNNDHWTNNEKLVVPNDGIYVSVQN